MCRSVTIDEYYSKPDSLILSARINNQRIETIEISLKTMEIIQSRGACNKDTEFHHIIIKLVRKKYESHSKKVGCITFKGMGIIRRRNPPLASFFHDKPGKRKKQRNP